MKKCPVCKRDIEEKESGSYRCICGYTEITASVKKENQEKALDILKRLKIGTVTAKVDGDRVYEPLCIAIEALEKQIPKKPINQLSWKACPTCEQGIGVNKETLNSKAIAYCYHCGQKLDWN